MTAIVHSPVLPEEVLAQLAPGRPGSSMIDCTLGEGGHAEAFLSAYADLRYLGIDADPRIQAKARERLAPFGSRMAFRIGFFDEVLASLLAGGGESPDRILFDLGISMHHYAESGRGFSYAKDEPLDMRLSPESPRSAADLVNGEREEELARIIFEYGEERLSRRIARAIVEARRSSPITTSGRLEEIIYTAVPAQYRHGRIHPATRSFQALRIAVNDELGRAARGLARAAALLAPGGRVGVITFHSLEDRIAKGIFKALAGRGDISLAPAEARPIIEGMGNAIAFRLPFMKPLEPSEAEVARNPASRSAKLRVLERLGSGEAAA